jgi:hypothetical protein
MPHQGKLGKVVVALAASQSLMQQLQVWSLSEPQAPEPFPRRQDTAPGQPITVAFAHCFSPGVKLLAYRSHLQDPHILRQEGVEGFVHALGWDGQRGV